MFLLSSSMTFQSRMDKIISWIKDEKQPANLVLAYFEEPDNVGHVTGDSSQEIRNNIIKADDTIKYLGFVNFKLHNFKFAYFNLPIDIVYNKLPDFKN